MSPPVQVSSVVVMTRLTGWLSGLVVSSYWMRVVGTPADEGPGRGTASPAREASDRRPPAVRRRFRRSAPVTLRDHVVRDRDGACTGPSLVTKARIVVPGQTLAVTRRTTLRKLLWTPSAPIVAQGFLYALAEAQQRYDVEVHHVSLMPTHHHTTITPREANAPAFYRMLHRESGRFLQELLLELGYDAPPNVWDGRPTHDMILVDVGAQLEWLLYEHVQAVAAGLVERVEEYPGLTTDFGLMKSGVLGVKKPPIYYGKSRASELPVRFSMPPTTRQGFGGDVERGFITCARRAGGSRTSTGESARRTGSGCSARRR